MEGYYKFSDQKMVKMGIFPKLIYKFNTIPVKTKQAFPPRS